MHKITLEEVQKDLRYDPDDGNFYWVNPKPGRPSDRPAGFRNHQGYVTITYNGAKIQAQRLAFLFMTGDWPKGMVGYKDGDPVNNSWNNLKIITNKERTQKFIESLRDHTAKQKKEFAGQVQKKVRKPTFSHAEVHQAVEEFIKGKELIDGVYVRTEHSKASS